MLRVRSIRGTGAWIKRWRSRYGGLTSLLAIALLLFPACQPGNPLGDVLDNMTNDVNSVITNAINSSDAAALSAAAVVLQEIDNAESAYATQLNTSLENLNANIQSVISRLETDVRDLQSGVLKAMKQAASDAHLLLNQIPFTNKNPQLGGYAPQLVAFGGKGPSVCPPGTPDPGAGCQTFHLSGNWPLANQQKQMPKLHVGNATLDPVGLTTTAMDFDVPVGLLAPQSATQFADNSLELDLPYQQGSVFKSIKPGVFRLLVTELPTSPVQSLTLTNNQPVTGTQTQQKRMPAAASGVGSTYSLESYSTCRNDVLTPPLSILPDPTPPGSPYKWQLQTYQIQTPVLRNSAAVHITMSAWQANLGQLQAHTEPGTPCLPGVFSSGSGDVSFFVNYTEQITVVTSTPTTTPVQLGWGWNQVIPVSPHNWRLDALMFDGRHISYTTNGEDPSNPPFLKVVDQGNNVQISSPGTDGMDP